MALRSILIIPDTHIPYHDQKAWSLMLKVGRYLKPHALVSMGDLADFYNVSRFSKNPNRITQLDEEVKQVNKALDELDKLGAKEKIFIEGNHCDRLRRYLEEKAPELFNTISIPKLFNLKDRKWDYVPYKYDTQIGKLYLTHDIGTATRYSVYRCLEAYQHSIVTAHTHRFAYVVEGDAVGEQKVSAQFGWLGDIEQVDYMHQIQAKKNWALGFGIGYHDTQTDVVYLVPIPIVNYSCVVNGKLFKI